MNRAWSLVMQGKLALGTRLLRDGVAAIEATGAAVVRPAYLGMLAAVDAMSGERAVALAGFDRALAEIERTGERVHEVGLLIGKSQVLASPSRTGGKRRPRPDRGDEAEACLRRALELARVQQARLLELRAAIALVRHCGTPERGAEARDVLAGACRWFEQRGQMAPEIAAARELLAGCG